MLICSSFVENLQLYGTECYGLLLLWLQGNFVIIVAVVVAVARYFIVAAGDSCRSNSLLIAGRRIKGID